MTPHASFDEFLLRQADLRCAYLDIETSYQGEITIIGIHQPRAGTRQLMGRQVTPVALLEALAGVRLIKTYNGDRFDLPVIRQCLGVDLKMLYPHQDIMYDCWKQSLKGGLKSVEKQLGLCRTTDGVDGRQAMALWARWQELGDRESLDLLLAYNREDVEYLAKVEYELARKVSGGAKFL